MVQICVHTLSTWIYKYGSVADLRKGRGRTLIHFAIYETKYFFIFYVEEFEEQNASKHCKFSKH